METFTMNREDLESNANNVVLALANQLAKDGVVPSADTIVNRYVVVIHKKGKLGRFMDRLFGREDDHDVSWRVLQTGYDATHLPQEE